MRAQNFHISGFCQHHIVSTRVAISGYEHRRQITLDRVTFDGPKLHSPYRAHSQRLKSGSRYPTVSGARVNHSLKFFHSLVDLLELNPTGMLAGPNVKIVDTDSPATPHADASQPLLFDRSQPQFEEVNVYFQIDRSQRYMQSLGYTGARRIDGYAIPVDPHSLSGADNSLYMMSFSGAKGNLNQITQMAGMRGLMLDPNGNIIHNGTVVAFRLATPQIVASNPKEATNSLRNCPDPARTCREALNTGSPNMPCATATPRQAPAICATR